MSGLMASIFAASARATASESGAAAAGFGCTARSAPMASTLRSTAWSPAPPSEMATTSPTESFSLTRSACSTEFVVGVQDRSHAGRVEALPVRGDLDAGLGIRDLLDADHLD